MVYPQMTMPPPSQRVQMTPGMAYYSGDHRELYQTPTPIPRNGKFTPYPPQFAMPQVAYESQAQVLSNQSIGRSYDTTIPQYYPVTTDGRWYGQPDGRIDPTPKRKRKDSAPGLSTKKAKSRPQSEASRDSPAPKRAKHGTASPNEQPVQTQLPTPPSTGHVTNMTLSSSTGLDDSPPASTAEPSTRRRGAFITHSAEEGRQLKVGTKESNDEIALPRVNRSPRMTTIPAITTNANGLAVFSTDQVLESEMAWLEYPGHSPPSSPDIVELHTPHLPADNTSMLVEEQETPATRAERTEKRLAMFKESDEHKEEAMVSTRIQMFGRVAVRKDVAIKFLGLDPSRSSGLIEETASDDEGSWSARVDRPSSSKIVRPSWPDEEAPWALAGSSRKDKLAREDQAKAAVLRRYLETASDDSSDEEDAPMPSRKGKAPQRYPGDTSSHRIWPNPHADAHTALLTSIRHRALPPMRMGKVACACGANQAIGVNPMVECTGCRTYHHLACCGIGDDAMVGPQWWCPRCSAAAMAMSTPARTSTPRVYTQSDERSSAFKGEMANIALAPSPMFVNSSTFTQHPQNTPLNRSIASPSSRKHKSRILSYGTDMWAYTEDGAPSSVAPSTPRPSRMDRFSTPRIEETPFDVTSTPSRHLDFNFGQPSLFSLTPLGARSRFGSTLLEATPFPKKDSTGTKSHLSEGISRHEFLKELGSGGTEQGSPATPGTRWPHALLGAHNLSPSPFAPRKASSGKLSSVRSTKSGLGLGMPLGAEPEEE